MGTLIRRFVTSVTQRALFAFEQFGRHEMANHAGAGAYAFLLSAGPAVLVILYVSSIAFGGRTIDLGATLAAVAPGFGDTASLLGMETLQTRPLAGFTGLFGLINLLWTSRLFIVSIQRGIRVVYADVARTNALRENLLTFAVELVVLLAMISLVVIAQVALPVLTALAKNSGTSLNLSGLALAARFLPGLGLWLFIFMTYRNVPAMKPRYRVAALAALLCTALFMIMGGLLGTFLDTERYGLLYGVMGNLIVSLVKVYAFFWLYYYFAELCYTFENIDALLFARFHRLSVDASHGKRFERTIFAQPGRIMRRYAKDYRAGDLIFAKGHTSKDAYYLYQGSIGIFLNDPEDSQAISTVQAGEFFGEMASILEEPRSAWAKAASGSTVIALPPDLFKRYLSQDVQASRRLMELLATRIKAGNAASQRAGGT
jgi:membrane protein